MTYLAQFNMRLDLNDTYTTSISVAPMNEPIPEDIYVENLAERNGCDLRIEARLVSHKGKERTYLVGCKDKEMSFTCIGGKNCWIN